MNLLLDIVRNKPRFMVTSIHPSTEMFALKQTAVNCTPVVVARFWLRDRLHGGITTIIQHLS